MHDKVSLVWMDTARWRDIYQGDIHNTLEDKIAIDRKWHFEEEENKPMSLAVFGLLWIGSVC